MCDNRNIYAKQWEPIDRLAEVVRVSPVKSEKKNFFFYSIAYLYKYIFVELAIAVFLSFFFFFKFHLDSLFESSGFDTCI